MRLFKLSFNSFVWGIVISVLAFQSDWLEMRINIGYFIPIVMILALVGYAFLSKKYSSVHSFNYVFTIVNIVVCSAICIVLLGLERLMIVPAAIIRELLFLTKVRFDIINIGLIIMLVLGFLIIFLSDFRYKKSSK